MIDPFGQRPYPEPYLNPRQAQTRPPTAYETLLADAIEAAFAAGVWDLTGLVARLNGEGIRTPDGQPWTEARYEAEMRRLGA